ncbi:hypothetical protein [Rhodococcus erythropolis]|uniref:hypothetical protein n=1 Tax=Rhodococcus erythropolis TaxID=1833 RepID=UPI0030137595
MSAQDVQQTVRSGTAHPLDPLTRDEIEAAVSILRNDRAGANTFRFVQVGLHEPSKAELASDLSVIDRTAETVLIDRATGTAYEARVNLRSRSVETWIALPAGTQPPIMLDEFTECEDNCKRDLRVREALALRGLTEALSRC